MAEADDNTSAREAEREAVAIVGEITVRAGGEDVTVRAHNWREAVALRAEARELVEAILDMQSQGDNQGDGGDAVFDYWAWLEIIVEHYSAFG
ncbi:MAG: hypothetical protein ACOCUS_03745, partial [Polyangiales bacterium]